MRVSNENEVNIRGELQTIYGDVSEWLKFLEAKHAAVFAVWTALLIAVVTSDFFANATICWKTIFVVPILIGCMLNMISFMPFLNKCKCLKCRCYQKYKECADNAVFYQAIFVKTYPGELDENSSAVAKYKDMLKEYFGQEILDKLTNDYVKQIVEVSAVATIKAYLFSISVKYTFLIGAAVIAGMIIA